MDGVLVVHKPVGPSSHDIVVVARRSLGISRVGHTGTLDPQASGVLPLVLGQATRLAQHLTASVKEYEAVIRFGVTTDTYDAAGEVVARSEFTASRSDLEAALASFRGEFQQTPPVFSAKMVEGQRSYVRARAGRPVRSAPVPVVVHALELRAFEPPLARLRVRCSAGFYVRALAHDLGQLLGPGAVLDGLLRTEAAGFTLDEAVALETLVSAARADLRPLVKPMETLLLELPAVELTPEGVDWARHGRDLGPGQAVHLLPGKPAPKPALLVRLLSPEGRLVGLADRAKSPEFLHPTVVFSYN
jgi:tRNA pseudouridine55 synthase